MGPNTLSSTAADLDPGPDPPSGILQMGEFLGYSIFRACRAAGITPLGPHDSLERSIHDATVSETAIATVTPVAERPNTTVPDPPADLAPQVLGNFDSSVLTSPEPVNSALQTGNVAPDGFSVTSSQPVDAETLGGRSGGAVVALQDSNSETGYTAVDNSSATSSELVATVALDQTNVAAEHSHRAVRRQRRQPASNPQTVGPASDVQRRRSSRPRKPTAPNRNK